MARKRGNKRDSGGRRKRRLIRFYDEFGEIKIEVPSAEARSFIARFHNAIRRYLEEGDASGLRPFVDRR